MKLFTKNQIKEIKKLDVEKHFNTVIQSQFKRGTSSTTDNKVAEIYETATGEKINRNFTCKSCVYNLYLKAGTLFKKSVEYYEQQTKLNRIEQMNKARQAKQEKKNEETNKNTE